MADERPPPSAKRPLLTEAQLEARRRGLSISVAPPGETAERETARLKRAVLATAAEIANDLSMKAECTNVFVPSEGDLVREGGRVRDIALYLTPALVDALDRDLMPMFIDTNGLLDHRLGPDRVQKILQFHLPASASLFPPDVHLRRPGVDGLPTVAEAQRIAAEPASSVSASPAAEGVPAGSVAGPRPVRPPNVAPSLLKRWYPGWVKNAGTAADSERKTLAAAREEFSDRLVTRQAIRELRGDRPRGRPKGAAK